MVEQCRLVLNRRLFDSGIAIQKDGYHTRLWRQGKAIADVIQKKKKRNRDKIVEFIFLFRFSFRTLWFWVSEQEKRFKRLVLNLLIFFIIISQL